MKANRDTPKPARREIFVLTPEEKKTVCFVLIAFVLGLATKHYRDAHPPLLPNRISTFVAMARLSLRQPRALEMLNPASSKIVWQARHAVNQHA